MAACGSGSGDGAAPSAGATPDAAASGSGAAESGRPDPTGVPEVDVSRTIVALEDVVFDTFDGGFTRLSEADANLIEQLRDAIRPIYEPRYGSADDLPWLADDDLVLGYQGGGTAFAYPFNVLNFRELVNDTIDGVPVLVSYCPLCGSAVVYDRRLAGETLRFGNTSALYESDLVMYDHGTGSYWFQVAGRAIVGELAGAELDVLPSTVATWGEWRALHPDGRLLIGDASESFAGGRYVADPFEGYGENVNRGRFAFPVSDAASDRRLRAAEVVSLVQVGAERKAYAIAMLDAPVNDALAGIPILVLASQGATFAAAFDRRVGGQVLTFDALGPELVDRETGTTWDRGGRALSGPGAGAQLEPLPLRRAFWFSIVSTHPGVPLYGE